jgi:uncharacterized membrane protein YqgA involved in biofilm formation
MITVAVGATLGLLIGNRLSARIQESVITGLGLMTLFIGIQNGMQTGNPIIPLLSIASGVIIGELLNVQAALEGFGAWLQRRFAKSDTHPDNEEKLASTEKTESAPMDARTRFITGFVTSSLVFCIGPLTFVGSMQDGMGLALGFQQLAIKSVLDGFAAMAFAASFGAGVLFSVITILVLQGGLALAGSLLGNFMSQAMINEMTAVGGLLLVGLALILLDVKRPRMANFLPALVIAPVLVGLAEAVGINIYP